MADFTAHAPGTFSWPELATTDQQGGVAFYRALFGWDVNEQPIGPAESLPSPSRVAISPGHGGSHGR